MKCYLLPLVCVGLFLSPSGWAEPAVLQTFTLTDVLGHQWSDELVHFDVNYEANDLPPNLTLTNSAGEDVPCQVSNLRHEEGRVVGTVWTVVTLPSKGRVTLQLRSAHAAATGLQLRTADDGYELVNERVQLRLPNLPGPLTKPTPLTSLPAPLLALREAGTKTWLGEGTWLNDAHALNVKKATTTIVENGPVRVTVRYRLIFENGRFYQADISLGSRQDAALFTDETDVCAPGAAFRFSFQSGLEADRVFWANNYYADLDKGFSAPRIDFDKDKTLFRLRPWSYWWLQDRATWAGFFRDGAEPFIGVIALRPFRWSPYGWDGFEHTEIPVTVRAGIGVDLRLGLTAFQPEAARKPPFPSREAEAIYIEKTHDFLSGALESPWGVSPVVPLHRELAITVGAAGDYIDFDKLKLLAQADEAAQQNDIRTRNRLRAEARFLSKLRQQLVKYSEFPLDEVKDFDLIFDPADPDRKHPFLLFTQADIERARRQAETVPAMEANLRETTTYMKGCGVDQFAAESRDNPDAWESFFQDHYVHNYLYDHAPKAYVGSSDSKYGLVLAAGVRGLARQAVDQFLRNPGRATLGGNAHLGTTNLIRLLLAFDTLGASEYLTAAEKQEVRAALVFGAHVINHPDYWNTDRGLCSANPNMTSLMRLPLGMFALLLDGHPRAAEWLTVAESELQRELQHFIAGSGAWLECPFYQGPSLDGMFLLAQALKNVKGRDYFADPQFQATMDYYGFILTPPDVRFPPPLTPVDQALMTVPSLGDAMPGHVTPFAGWMAAVAADPVFSAQQQFYWQKQGYRCTNGGRAGAYMAAICDPELPVRPPARLSRAFDNFGSILRSSWTDPAASYVCHRSGYFHHHYDPGDANSFIYFAKGAPLCMDFAHRAATGAEVKTMWRPDYHNTVSFDLADSPKHWGLSNGSEEANRKARLFATLPRTADYSAGKSYGSGGQTVQRQIVQVKSEDVMGANYLVIRDRTTDGQPNQEFFWNLWCLATGVEIDGNRAHFPGQFGVDLDVHVLSPAKPQFQTENYKWSAYVYDWKNFSEEQYGVHVRKQGSDEDFFTVLYPRAAGQGPATVTRMNGGNAAEVVHMEGTDVLLLSPGQPASLTHGEIRLAGHVALVRSNRNGALRLAVIGAGNGSAAIGDWELAADGTTAVMIEDNNTVEGESSGPAHDVSLILPPTHTFTAVLLDGAPLPAVWNNRSVKFRLPDGVHEFVLR